MTPCRLLFYTEASGPPSAQVSANVRVRAFRGLQSGGSSRANEPRPQKHSRGRDPLAPAGPESSARLARAVMGKGLDLDAWIAKVRARPCAVVRLRVDAASKCPLRASFSSTRPDLRRSRRGSANAPRVARARAVARRRRASALSRNARTSNRERVSLTLHASRALPSSPVFTFSQISDRNRKRRRSSVASRWRRASSSLCAGTSRKCSWRRATCSRCVRP